MSNESNSDEIPIEVISNVQNEKNLDELTNNKTFEKNMDNEEQESTQTDIEKLTKLLDLEKLKVVESDEKLKHVLADFQNLSKKTQTDIEHGVNAKVDEFVLDFLKIYDDFVRAKDVFSQNKINTDGLVSILKNMDSLLKKYKVTPIDALGEIFDPNSHEAISIIIDPDLDDNTITKEIRTGYFSQNRIIRATLVEISKQK